MVIQRNSKSVQIAEQYKMLLVQKRLKAGSRAASVRKLMNMYHISSSTADKVLRHLVEEDVLYRTPSRGTFVKNDPPEELRLGFTATEFTPQNASDFCKMNARSLKKFFREQQIEPVYIPYDSLLDPDSAGEIFRGINALLLDGAYVDGRTLPQLKLFPGPIALTKLLFPIDSLPVSQVLPDCEVALLELEDDIRRFRKVIIFSAGHPNALRQEKMIRKILSGMKVETVVIGNSNVYASAYRYFLKHKTGYEDVLLIMLSGLFSAGLRNAFGTDPLPQILEVDNWEASLADPEHNSIFTAIDPRLTDCFQTAVSLLKRLVTEKDSSRHIIFVKPRIVVRKSFLPKIYLKNKSEKEEK